MYGEQGEHKHVFEYKHLRISEYLVITVPHKKTWGTESPSESPGNIGCSHCSPVPPFFFYRHIWAMEQSGRGNDVSLLSGLLDHIPPAVTGTESPTVDSRPRPRLVLATRVERPAQFITGPHANAATATPEWRQARDQYLTHIMICRSCYAPKGRHCTAGAHLRASYDHTPMEARP